MKKKSLLFLLIFISTLLYAQQDPADSLRKIISKQKGDAAEVDALVSLANQQSQSDSAIKYAQQGLLLAEKINYRKGKADCLFLIGFNDKNLGLKRQELRPMTIKYLSDALDIYEDIKCPVGMATAHLVLQANYREAGDLRKAVDHGLRGAKIAEVNNVIGKLDFPGHRLAPLFLAEIAGTYVLMNQLDSAIFYTQKSIDQNELFESSEWNFPVYLLATYQTMKGDYKSALENYHRAKTLAVLNNFPRDTLQILSGMSTLFKKIGEIDSTIYYAQIVVRKWVRDSEIKTLMEAHGNLAEAYKLKGNKDSAFKYIELFYRLKDSIFSREKDREIQGIAFNNQLKQQEIIAAQAKAKSRMQLYALAAGLFVLLLIAGILWRNSRQQKTANIKIEHAYNELKSTQAQLIQSEKMASLGELTAGIAHEIQNPLNFVNNFSEVNTELLGELVDEVDKGNAEEVKSIAKDIKDNEEKINHHGKRADAIVKNMLQHSRQTSGVREPTDISALCDEYLRLSYHGFRAKDKNFNATLQTDFDPGIGKINIIPQDIGRVLLNLFNNAFYAVNEKLKAQGSKLEAAYKPTVIVTTRKINNAVEIKVSDNGNGIPQNIIDKIFQPFFTTKPTGEGTGLGLSLCYDIIKAHGGEIKVETKENEGSEFLIQLAQK